MSAFTTSSWSSPFACPFSCWRRNRAMPGTELQEQMCISKCSLVMALLIVWFSYTFHFLCGRSGTSRRQIPQLPHTLGNGTRDAKLSVGFPVSNWMSHLPVPDVKKVKKKLEVQNSGERTAVIYTLWGQAWFLVLFFEFMGSVLYCQQTTRVLLQKLGVFCFFWKGF